VQDKYVDEMVTFAELVGIESREVPRTVGQMENFFQEIMPKLSASDDAKRAALFIALPPLPPLLRFGTPIAPLWSGITSLAAAALPRWACKLYGWPTVPGQDNATDLAIKATWSAFLFLPESLRQPQNFKVEKVKDQTA
jgi:uncharacterized protein (DUF2236 family)